MSVRFDVALVKEQGVRFAVVTVKRGVLDDPARQRSVVALLSPHVGGVPIVLMEQDSRGVPTYVGRPDLVKWLANNVFVEELPWRTMTLSQAA